MSRGDTDRIQDILTAIERCTAYQKTLDNADRPELVMMANDAIERNLQIIGEAANHLKPSTMEMMPGVQWPQIRGFRNILVHQYFGVDRSILSEVIAIYLPALAKELKEYQSSLDRPA